MKLSELTTHQEVLADALRDPKFRAEWQRTALARGLAIQVIRYRARHDLSQTELARRLGMKQPAVARLESGEHNPTIETLIRLARELEMELALDIAPDSRPRRLVTKLAETKHRVESLEFDGCRLLIAAA